MATVRQAVPINGVNRTPVIDSKLSLDANVDVGELAPMQRYPFNLYCQRLDATRNMARYYSLSIEPTLFGEIAVTRCWGRIGRAGGEKIETFASEYEAAKHFLEIARKKKARGYKPVGNCGNPAGEMGFAAPRR